MAMMADLATDRLAADSRREVEDRNFEDQEQAVSHCWRKSEDEHGHRRTHPRNGATSDRRGIHAKLPQAMAMRIVVRDDGWNV
jgi:hypothetical protein